MAAMLRVQKESVRRSAKSLATDARGRQVLHRILRWWTNAVWRGVGRRIGVAAASAMGWGAIVAAPTASAVEPVDCNRAGTAPQFERCAERDYAHADAELNRVYKRARATLRSSGGAVPADDRRPHIVLRDAQRAWITFRDDACAAEAAFVGAKESRRLALTRCKERLTTRRVLDLRLLVGGGR